MSGFDYARAKATADRLLARFGQAGSIRRIPVTGSAHNPTKGTPANHAVNLVVIDYQQREIDGTRVLASDRRAYVSAAGLTIQPETSDLLVDAAGAPYKIVAISPLNPAGTTVLYEMQVRR